MTDEEKLERKPGLRRYMVELYGGEEGSSRTEYFRGRNKPEVKAQLMEAGLLGRMKTISARVKQREERKRLKPVFKRPL